MSNESGLKSLAEDLADLLPCTSEIHQLVQAFIHRLENTSDYEQEDEIFVRGLENLHTTNDGEMTDYVLFRNGCIVGTCTHWTPIAAIAEFTGTDRFTYTLQDEGTEETCTALLYEDEYYACSKYHLESIHKHRLNTKEKKK